MMCFIDTGPQLIIMDYDDEEEDYDDEDYDDD